MTLRTDRGDQKVRLSSPAIYGRCVGGLVASLRSHSSAPAIVSKADRRRPFLKFSLPHGAAMGYK